jgi:undecaprenyl-diphosphatase
MHDYGLSLLLGIVEGLTEFLPVSSTAHLRIVESFLGIDLGSGFWKMYTIVIQLGAILAVPLYFKARIRGFLRTFPTGVKGDRTALTHPLALTVIAFVVTAIPALLLTKVIGKNLESLSVMGWALVVGGVMMWLVDAFYGAPLTPHPTQDIEQIGMGQAIWVGACQILSAVFPGTSRSMATIAAGQIGGMSRSAALEFSFFLSMPTMAAATIYDLYKSFHHQPGATDIGTAPTNAHEWFVLAIGFVVSFVVALGVIHWFMRWVRTRGFVPFAIYRILAGGFVLYWASQVMARG